MKNKFLCVTYFVVSVVISVCILIDGYSYLSWIWGLCSGIGLINLINCFAHRSKSSCCPIEDCDNTSCDHYSKEYHTCCFTEVPIDPSTLRYWILIYVDAHGTDALYELINGKSAPEVSCDD